MPWLNKSPPLNVYIENFIILRNLCLVVGGEIVTYAWDWTWNLYSMNELLYFELDSLIYLKQMPSMEPRSSYRVTCSTTEVMLFKLPPGTNGCHENCLHYKQMTIHLLTPKLTLRIQLLTALTLHYLNLFRIISTWCMCTVIHNWKFIFVCFLHN
jgi:hypothetical protein